jgi:hypothetical protein
MDGDEIRAVVTRLSRPHPSGGRVIERAAMLDAGGDYRAIMAWVLDHDGVAEPAPPAPTRGGLHGGRVGYSTTAPAGEPARFVIPSAALG